MAALCAVTAIISVAVPFAGGIVLLGTVPAGLLAYRYRLRVLITMTVAAGVIAFLIAGMGAFMGVIQSAYIGGLTGVVKRRGRGTPTVVVTSFIAGVVFAAGNVGALMALVRLRHLMRDAITANVDGMASFLGRVHMQSVGFWLKWIFAWSLRYWQPVLLGIVTISVMGMSLIGWWALSRLLERMRGIPDVHKLDAPAGDHDSETPIGPVPVRLDKVRFRYPGADQDALRELSMDIRVGEHVAITGANGSGKTTLMLILAGREPTSGTVQRPGRVGLGGWVERRLCCSIRRVRCWGPGSPTTWCGVCRRAPRPMSPSCCARSGSRNSPNATPAACPAVNCSGWRWRPRWRVNRRC